MTPTPDDLHAELRRAADLVVELLDLDERPVHVVCHPAEHDRLAAAVAATDEPGMRPIHLSASPVCVPGQAFVMDTPMAVDLCRHCTPAGGLPNTLADLTRGPG